MHRLRVPLIILLLLATVVSWAQPYTILSMDVRMKLDKSGRVDVEERIKTRFNIERRGIFRYIPIAGPNGRGAVRQIYLSGLSVTDDGDAKQTTLVKREGENLSIRIGDEKIVFPPNTEKTYVIRYSVQNAINWQKLKGWDGTAELYWNAIGERWDTDIESANVVVDFPKEADKSVAARVFWGSYGSRENLTLMKTNSVTNDPLTGTILKLESGRMIANRSSVLPAYNGMTIALAVPEELIVRPSFLQSAWWFLQPNLGFTIPFWMFLGLIVMWFKFGRDPKPGPMIVQYDVPDGMTGPECGTLIDERVDQRDLASGIVSLATKGYLTITPTQEGILFKKTSATMEITDKPLGPDLSAFERKLHSYLSACGNPISASDLRTHVAPNLATLQNILYQEMVTKGFYRTNPNSVKGGWGCMGFLVVVALGFGFTWISVYKDPLPAIVGGILGAIVVFSFAPLMSRRTPQGVMAWQKVKGFEEFIARARGDELDWISKKEPTQALFEEYLPFAVAFGLTKQWAEAFRDITLVAPSWYHTSTPHYTFINFGSDLEHITSDLGSSASTPPRSSGSSGGGSGFSSGGFSGGGFGGGGGSSW